jgi:hypothetical protein
MELKTEGLKIGYSPREKEAFGFLSLGESHAATTKELAERRYGADPPYHSLSIMNAVMNSLSKKMKINREPIMLKKSSRNGPHPIHYWLERRR